MTRQLTSHDAALWQTIYLNELIDAGRLEEWPTPPTHFPPQGPHDRFLTTGPFRLSDFRPVGDGSYQHNSGFFFASGRGGMAMTAGLMAGRAIGNSRRRNRAAADAQARWVTIGLGQVWVSVAGFTCQDTDGLYSWHHGAIDSAQLVSPGHLHFTGTGQAGPVSWVLSSDWAELVFTLWARARHPQHQAYMYGSWIPGGWRERTLAADRALPPALTSHSAWARSLAE